MITKTKKRKSINLRIAEASPLTVSTLKKLLDNFLKVVNYNYWLHPEYETPDQYINEHLKKQFPNYKFFYSNHQKTIKIYV